MKRSPKFISFISVVVLMFLLSMANGAKTQVTQDPPFLSSDVSKTVPHIPLLQRCNGPVSSVVDVGFEGVRTTPWIFGTPGGGGEGACYDPTPLLTTSVNLTQVTCLNAHLSAIVGSQVTYGVARMTFFQVTLTSVTGGVPQHMFGHFDTPFGISCPAVALEAERDVDMYASNFFQRVGPNTQQGEVPPGAYRVDVWWAGGPGAGGAIGAGFVLKLYLR